MMKCPACSAQIPDDASTCEYCGSSLPALDQATEKPLPQKGGAPSLNATTDDPSSQVKSFQCESCGAVVSYSASKRALHCAYCGSSYVVDVPTRTDREQPNRIVPFSVDRFAAVELFSTWLGKGFWRPGDLKSRAQRDELQGVYLPFWSYDVRAHSTWTASAGYHYKETEAYTDKEGKPRTRIVTKTRWEPANGEHRFAYNDRLVLASGGLDASWVARIVPFQLDQAKPYSPDYLAGWAAETYSLEADEGQKIAQGEIEAKQVERCGEQVPGDTHQDLHVSTAFSDWSHELIVLPIWISSYRYRDEVYRFLVNGQTGEVVGKAPVSKLKVAVAVGIGAAIVIGVAIWQWMST